MERVNKSETLALALCLFFCSSVLTGSSSKDHAVKCGYTFNRDLVHVTCNTTQNLPEVGCLWYIFLIANKKPQKLVLTNTSEYVNDLGSCKTALKPLREGQYTASLIMNSTKADWKQIGGQVLFNITRNKSPTLKVHNALRTNQDSLVQVDENITLVCYDNESVPLPYNISITCGGFERPSYKQHERKDHEGVSSVVFTLNKVSDRMNCMCEAHHISSPHPSQTSTSFTLFSTPLMPACNYSFLENFNADIVCTTSRVYPKAKCTWGSATASALRSKNTWHQPVGSEGYVSTECWVKLKLSMQLSYTVYVTMFPDVHGTDLSTTSAVTSQPITVLVDIPRTAPVFKLKRGQTIVNHLTVVDQENVTVVCSVSGGKPMVHKTQISCHKNTLEGTSSHLLGHSNGSETSIHLQINKSLHQTACTCSADHVSQAYSLTSTFTIDVQSQAVIESFQLLPHPPHGTHDYTPGSQITLWCNVSGRPVPQIELGHANQIGETKVLKQVTGQFTNYSLTASCNNAGIYTCTAFNNLTLQAQIMKVNFSVKCHIEHCDVTETVKNFKVPVGDNVTISLCVVAYQVPTSYTLYKGNKETKIGGESYKTSFDYTDKTLSKGLISLNIHHLNVSDLGDYTLQSDLPNHGKNIYSIDVNFTLTPEGPPLCPYDVRAQMVSEDQAVLTWRPGFDGGLVQTFIILSHNDTTFQPDEVAVVDTGVPTLTGVVGYNLTGLTKESFHVFSVQAENSKGKTKCRDPYVTFTIAAKRDAGDVIEMVSLWSTSLALTVVFTSLLVAMCTHWRAVRYGPWMNRREITVENLLYVDRHLTALDKNDISETLKDDEFLGDTVKQRDQDSSETYGNARALNLNVESETKCIETVYTNVNGTTCIETVYSNVNVTTGMQR